MKDYAPSIAAVEACFGEIAHTRMADVPIVNPVLEVEAIGFRTWQGYRLGALLSPWFLNLMLLPAENAVAGSVGSQRPFALPAGGFTFVVGHEGCIGTYASCSLMSPVLEFSTQADAVAVAEASLRAVFDAPSDALDKSPSASDSSSTPALSRRDFFNRVLGRREGQRL